MSVGIIQIHYNEQTASLVSPCAIPYDNSAATNEPALENHVIKRLMDRQEHTAFDYFGVLSWKFEKKSGLNLCRQIEKITDADIYSFFGYHHEMNMWEAAERWHRGIIEIANHILEKIGYKIDVRTIRTPVIYQNAFIARSSIYKRYYDEMLSPCLDLILQPTDWLRDRLYQNSNHEYHRIRKDLSFAEQVKKTIGVPYYPYHAFLCERLLGTWLSVTPGINLKHLT